MKIKELILKYREDSLTIEELHEMRRLLDELSFDEITEAMNEIAQVEQEPEEPEVSAELVARVRERLQTEINRREESEDEEESYSGRYYSWRWIAGVAACVAVVVGVGLSFFYSAREDRLMASSGYTEIHTQFGERSRIVLPDGTTVRLMGRSRLRWPSDMSVNERRVEFNGEAYFEVARNVDRPFTIVTDGMNVRVLGTEFNVYARPDVGFNEVILDNGAIELELGKGGSVIRLRSQESVVIDKKNGSYEITRFANNPSVRRRVYGVSYQNVSPDSLIKDLERTFEVKINDDIRTAINSPFSGTLPDDDINESLTILSKVYNFKTPYIHEGDRYRNHDLTPAR